LSEQVNRVMDLIRHERG